METNNNYNIYKLICDKIDLQKQFKNITQKTTGEKVSYIFMRVAKTQICLLIMAIYALFLLINIMVNREEFGNSLIYALELNSRNFLLLIAILYLFTCNVFALSAGEIVSRFETVNAVKTLEDEIFKLGEINSNENLLNSFKILRCFKDKIKIENIKLINVELYNTICELINSVDKINEQQLNSEELMELKVSLCDLKEHDKINLFEKYINKNNDESWGISFYSAILIQEEAKKIKSENIKMDIATKMLL